jgi:ribosomal protein L23
MTEYLLEYSSIALLLGLSIYLIRHKIKEYFTLPSLNVSEASLGIKVKNGYISLLDLLYHNSNKEDLEREIRLISTHLTDGRYVGGYTKDTDEFDIDSFILDYFYEILNYTEAKDEEFIFTVSKISDMEKLHFKLEKLFGDKVKKVDKSIFLHKSIKEILRTYKELLLEYQIEMKFISDGSDSYYFIFYPTKNRKEVSKGIKQIGLEETTLN